VDLPAVPLPASPSELRSRFYTPSMEFTVTLYRLGSRFSHKDAISRRQDSLHATDRLVAPSKGLLTRRFDTRCFHRIPASATGLPGVTRNGLSPVGHHQLAQACSTPALGIQCV
jgi:hypothetical protein